MEHFTSNLHENIFFLNKPEIFILNFGTIDVIFMVSFVSSTASPDFIFPAHCHSTFELQCIVAEQVELLIDNTRRITLQEGDLLLLPPHMLHSDLTPSFSFSRRTINFSIIPSQKESSETELSNSDAFLEHLFSQVNQEIIYRNAEIVHSIKNIFCNQEIDISDPFFTLKTKAYLSLIFEEIARHLKACTSQPTNVIQQHILPQYTDMQRTWLIDSYVATYYMYNNHIDNLACLLNLSSRQVCRVVKALTNRSLQEQILEQRMAISMHYITETSLSLQQISEAVGYSTYPGFYTAFCKFYGCSPETYRKKQQ